MKLLLALIKLYSSPFRKFYVDEKGLGTLEIVLIIAALVIVALFFGDQIIGFVEHIISDMWDTDPDLREPEGTF